MKTNYYSLKKLIEQYVKEETQLTEEKIMQMMDDAYEQGQISSREYEDLMCLF